MTRWLRGRHAKRAASRGHEGYIAGAYAALRPDEGLADEATLCVLRPWATSWSAGHHDIGPLGTAAGFAAAGKRHRQGC